MEVEALTIVLAPPQPTNASLLEGFAVEATLRRLTTETLRAYLSYAHILARFLESRGKGFLDLEGSYSHARVLRVVCPRCKAMGRSQASSSGNLENG